MTPVVVLVTAASRRVALVQGFRRAVEALGGGRVIVTDVNPLSPAVYTADRAYRVPLASDDRYIDEILAICASEGVRLVVPTIDDELATMATAAARFARDGIRVAVSPLPTVTACVDKYVGCQTLRAAGVRAATSWLPGDVPAAPAFPLFIKPRVGRGSVGAFHVRHRRDLAFFLDYVPHPVVQEFLDGPEFTIDMLCDFAGRPVSIVPRERLVIRAGVTDRGRTTRDPRLLALAEACARALPFAGAVNVQCRMVDGEPVVFEVNARFSGGIPLTMAAGADFPLMLTALALGRGVGPSPGCFREGLFMTSYEASLFLSAADVRLEPLASTSSIEEPV